MTTKIINKKLFDQYTIQQAYLSSFDSQIPLKVTLRLKAIFEKYIGLISDEVNPGNIRKLVSKMEDELYKEISLFFTLTEAELKKVVTAVYDSTVDINNRILFKSSKVTKQQEENRKKDLPILFGLISSPLAIYSGERLARITHKFSTFLNSIFDNTIKLMKWDALQLGLEDIKEKEFITSFPVFLTQTKNLLKTFYFHVASSTKKKVWDGVSEITGYRYAAVLDSRTTPLCRALNGTIKSAIEDLPQPPLHWHCRSTIVPLIGVLPDSEKWDGDISNIEDWLLTLDSKTKKATLDSKIIPGPTQPKRNSISFKELKILLDKLK